MKVKEKSEKAGLKLNIQRTKIMASGPISSWQKEGEKVEIDFWAPKSLQTVTAEIKLKDACFLEGKMTTLNSVLKGRDITLSRKVCIVKVMAFPVVLYRCESWTRKKAECQRTDAFELWCWSRLLRVPWTTACQASLPFTIFWSLLKLISIESVRPSNHLILCCPLLLPSVFPSIRVFCSESALPIKWLKYWSFSFNISSSNEYSGLISFRIDWFDLPAVQGTLKHLFQHHGSKASIFWRSAFFMFQLSHPYMSAGKTMVLTIWTFVSKVITLLFNTPSRWP